jgi:macrolide transport system ATP-binding/permease protein
MSNFWQDLKFAARMLRRSPGFTAVAVLSLALGIGGNATVFTWAQAVLLHPLQMVKDSRQIVAAESVMPDGEYHTSSYPDYKDFRDDNHVFSGTIGFEFLNVNLRLPSEETAQRNWGIIATENYFEVLGVRAAMGRTFYAGDDHGPGSDPYVVLGNRFWRLRFASDPNVVGKTVSVNGHPFTIIGVAPAGFNGTIVGIAADYFIPMMMQPQALPGESLTLRNPTFVHIMGRLKSGVSLAQAQADLATVAAGLASEFPDTTKNVGIYVCPVWKANYGMQDFLLPVLVFLMVVALLVLLIACANVANLLLARATKREREIAIRSALGAARVRLIRQLLAESCLLAALGGAGGILLALWGTNLLKLFMPPLHLPVGVPLRVDFVAVLFTSVLSLLTVGLFGLAPALAASRPNVNQSLKEGRASSPGASRRRLKNLLVIGETVLAIVLLTSAGLLIRSLSQAEKSGPGFNTENVLLTAMDLRANGYTDDQAAEFYGRLVGRIQSLPGVKSASLEHYVPLWFTGRSYTIPEIEGYTPKPNEDMMIDLNSVGPNYFSLLQIPVIEGRDFTAADRAEAPRVCIVNQTMARRFWPRKSVVGQRIHARDHWWTVVGVARDVKYHTMNETAESFIYFPFLQDTATDANILVRTSGDPLAALGAVRAQVRALDPNASILEEDDLAGLLQVSLFANRTAAGFAADLGLLGLLLAAIGLYGVLSYTVGQRTHEIGVRMALGARPLDVLRMVVGQGMKLAMCGAAIGLVAALTASRLLSSLLYGISSTDPLTFIVAAAVLSAAAFVACYIPARRAMRVDPMVALRYE